MTRATMGLIGVGLSFVLGCEAPETTPRPVSSPSLVVTDSADLRLVSFSLQEPLPALHLHPNAEWVIGDHDATVEVPLWTVADALLLSDSVLFIAEGRTRSIVRVDLERGTVTRLGGEGDGPNEFRGLGSLHEGTSGAIGAFDSRRLRYVELDDHGGVVVEESVPSLPRVGTVEYHVAGDGTAFLFPTGPMPPPDAPIGQYRARVPVLRVAEHSDTLTVVSGRAHYQHGHAVGGVVFGAESLMAAAPSGVWIGDTAEQEVRYWSSTGLAPTLIVRWTMADREVSPQRKEAFLDHFFERESVEDQATRSMLQEMIRFADEEPAFGSLLTSSSGSLWIGSSVPPESTERHAAQDWVMVDVHGEALARLTTPEGFRLLQIEEGFVIGVHTDELGVESVRLHRVETGQLDSAPGER